MSYVERTDPEIFQVLQDEERRQETHLELIASENFVSRSVMEAMGSVLTNKYAEGYPGKRYYGGCQFVDVAENLARDRAKALFGCDHVNVQPHSGSQANMAVYFVALEPGDKYLALDLAHGGHLTMGSPVNFSGKIYRPIHFGVHKRDGRLDYDGVEAMAVEHKPKLIVIGASAYARKIDFARCRAIADKVGALLWADIAHIAGLVVAGLHPDPVPHCDFVTTTTHKTLRGPRGGMIMCKAEWAKKIDSAIFPGSQGGPLMHVIAAKAVAFKEALELGFKEYQRQIVANAAALADELMKRGRKLVSGGTDNHLMLMDFSGTEMTGKLAEKVLDEANITANKNMVPFDARTPFVTSGIRLGTPAVTTRGMKEAEMRKIGELIDRVLRAPEDAETIGAVRDEVLALCESHPLYRE